MRSTDAEAKKYRFAPNTLQAKRVAHVHPMRCKHWLPVLAIRAVHTHPAPRKQALRTLIRLAQRGTTLMTRFLLLELFWTGDRTNVAMTAKRAHVGASAAFLDSIIRRPHEVHDDWN